MNKIQGYRELSAEEIERINRIKSIGVALEAVVHDLRLDNQQACEPGGEQYQQQGEAHRWISIGQTHLQQGLMALTRAVAKPGGF